MLTQNYLAHYWHALSDGRIQCDLCPRACKLKDGQYGVCFIRQRINNQMLLTAYGKVSSIAVDPIEKKPLYHFLPGSLVYSFGTIGCNLQCNFCQNWHISSTKNHEGLYQEASPLAIANAAKKNGCQSVAFTYNEPIIALEYVVDVAKECRKIGLKTIAVTNGYIAENAREEFFSYMDAANVDLKGFTENFYRNMTGAHLQPVLDTLVYLKKHTPVWLEITTLLIPGVTDDLATLTQEVQWLYNNLGVDVPIHFSAFYPAWKMLERNSTPAATLIAARDLALQQGLRYVYTGNIYHTEGSKTICHNCHQCLLAREGFTITASHIDGLGRCNFCQTPCAGIYI